jgi:hypothetical protein
MRLKWLFAIFALQHVIICVEWLLDVRALVCYDTDGM